MRKVFFIVAALALLAVTPLPAAADSPDDDTFVYISTEDDVNFEVTISNGRGGGERRITSKLTLYRPAISPDGTRIAFSAPIGDITLGHYGIAVVNLDGTGYDLLTAPPYGDFSPTWSPDGTQIAFVRDRESNLNNNTCCVLKVMDSDGTNKMTIPGTLGAANPAWSPTSDEIAYDTSGGVFVTNVDGTNQRTIAPAGRTQPAWSPNGNEIAFVRDAGSEHRIVVAKASGATSRIWHATSLTLESPTWDLDGHAISFLRHSGEGYTGRRGTQVWSVDREENAERLFTPDTKIVHLVRYTRRGPECDFDGDARSDLAIGLPGQNVNARNDAGAVEILYSNNDGLKAGGSQQLHRGLNFVAGDVEAGARFGSSVVCGDFNSDLYSDLAIGAPGSANQAGSVTVMYGSAAGLTQIGQLWSQDSPGVVGAGRANEDFGTALTTGDFDGDGYFDLAVGTPRDRIDGDPIGSVNVLFGGAGGLSGLGDQLWHQNSPGIKSTGRAGEEFGAALASADFNGDSRDDLAIGVPGDVRGGVAMGAVAVLKGTKNGLTDAGDQRWHQDSPSVKGAGGAGDRFGASLAAGDFGGDGDGDLAIGVPGDTPNGVKAGAINVLYGQPQGLSAEFDDRFHQDSPGIKGAGKNGDGFGTSLIAGDFDGDNRTDLAIGVPGDTPNGVRAGVTQVLYATGFGLEPAGDQRWFQDVPGLAGGGEAGDMFGQSVAVGDFDGDGYVDLAVGVPGEDYNGSTDAGVLHAIYGTASGLAVANDQFWHQGITGVSGALEDGDSFGASTN